LISSPIIAYRQKLKYHN